MYQTFTLRFMAVSSNAGKDGFAPLMLNVVVNSSRVWIQLPQKVKPKDFNVKSQRSLNDDINSYIYFISIKTIFMLLFNCFIDILPTFIDKEFA